MSGRGAAWIHRDRLRIEQVLRIAIARQIVEAHGGEIRVAAGPGPGAELVVSMPVAAGVLAQRAAS